MAKKKSSPSRTSAKKKASPRSSGRKVDVYERERQRHAERGSRGSFFKPQKGKTKMRLIPFSHNGEEAVFEPNFVHFNVPGDKKAVRCPSANGQDCPICVLRNEVPKEVWEGTGRGGGIRPSQRFLANAVIRKSRDQKVDELVVADLPWSVWDGINQRIEDGEIDKAFDLKKGTDFIINRTEVNKRTKYEVSAVMSSKAVTLKPEPKDLIDLLGEMPDEKTLAKIADAIFESVS